MVCYGPLALVLSFLFPSRVDTACLAALEMDVSIPDVSLPVYFCFFLLTCVLEAPIYFFIARKNGVAWAGAFSQVLGLNLASHPFVFFVVPHLIAHVQQNTAVMILIGECFAILIEALLLRLCWRYVMPKAAITSLVGNLISGGLGIFLLENMFVFLRS